VRIFEYCIYFIGGGAKAAKCGAFEAKWTDDIVPWTSIYSQLQFVLFLVELGEAAERILFEQKPIFGLFV